MSVSADFGQGLSQEACAGLVMKNSKRKFHRNRYKVTVYNAASVAFVHGPDFDRHECWGGMQVDLDVEGAQVAEWPRFQQASFQGRRLKQIAFALGSVAGLGLVLAFFIGVFSPQSLWPVLLVSQGAGLLVLVAGLQSAWWVTQWRSRALLPAVDNLPVENEPVDNLGWYERLLERIGARGVGLLKQIGAPALWLAGWSVLVLLGLEQAWNLQLPAAALGVSASVGAVLSLLLAFGLLVFERQLAQQSPVEWPEAPPLDRKSVV